MGGFAKNYQFLAPQKLPLQLNVAPLRTIASEYVANITEDDRELGPDQLPKEVRQEVETFRAMRLQHPPEES